MIQRHEHEHEHTHGFSLAIFSNDFSGTEQFDSTLSPLFSHHHNSGGTHEIISCQVPKKIDTKKMDHDIIEISDSK